MMAIDPKTAAVCAEASGFWLMKTEPSECSIDDAFAATNHAVSWFGVRNYQARNFMRDQMKVGDAVLFYHSSCPNPGIVASRASPRNHILIPASSTKKVTISIPNPQRMHRVGWRWMLKALVKFPVIPVSILRAQPELADMLILRRGNRLSITPVEKKDFLFIVEHLAKPQS